MEFNLDTPIMERKTKTVYKDGDKTIKLFVENYSKSNILNEALNQTRIEEGTDLNVPKLIEITKINNRWAIVSEHIEGTPLDKLMQENPNKEDEYINKFVDIQLEILSKSVPLLNRMKDKYKRLINETQDLSNDARYELQQRLDGMKDHTKVCHGDYNPSNIIIKEDGTAYIIDWAHVTQGNASSDAARTYLMFKLEGKDDLSEKYLKLFSEKSGIGIDNIQRWIPIVAAAQKAKNIAEEQEFLNKWIDVIDYQ